MGFLSIDNGNKILALTQKGPEPLNCVVRLDASSIQSTKSMSGNDFPPQGYLQPPSTFPGHCVSFTIFFYLRKKIKPHKSWKYFLV